MDTNGFTTAIDSLKAEINRRTGVPVSLLDGNTPEEILTKARSLLAYRSQAEVKRPKSNAEKFASWFHSQFGEEESKDEAGAALEEITEALRRDQGGYPRTSDPGEIDPSLFPDPRSTAEKFGSWFRKQTAFDPTIDKDGWKRFT